MTQFEDRQIIGVLVADKDEALNGKDNVFINRSSAIQYMLKSLIIPKEGAELFTGYMSSFEDEVDFEDDQYINDFERIEKFKGWMNKQLLVFSYRVTGDGDYAKVRKVNQVARPISFNENTDFYAVPVFSAANDEMISDWCGNHRFTLWRTYNNLSEFQKFIYEKKSVGTLYGYNLNLFKPSFVVWKDEDGKLFAIGGITDITYDSVGGIILGGKDIFKINISDYVKFAVYDMNVNPTVMFIPSSIYKDIGDAILKDSVSREKKKELEIEKIPNDVANKGENEIESIGEDIREVTEHSNEKLIEIDTSQKNDKLIIDSMDYHSQRNGLYYSMRDLVNVHTAIKCSNLVILSGLSGTGKSKLVEMYAKALGINQETEDRLLIIPVRPSWNDDADLLGYVDLVHMVYRPSDTGFVDFLVKAQKDENKGKMYIVCFDEMNLARVEHYFSQFLSILERKNNRELPLYNKQYKGRLYNSKDYPDKIEIGDNIKFIGTVNIDESTYHFSDKVLDRANVIQLDVLNYATDWKNKPYANLSNISWSKNEYTGLVEKATIENSVRLHELLWDIHQLMRSASAKYGVGPRIVEAIETYINNLPEKIIDEFDDRMALDYQIVQRVLTKVRGPESQLRDILKQDSDNNFYQIFDKYNDLSDFEKCKETIAQKQKELEAYGYCM